MLIIGGEGRDYQEAGFLFYRNLEKIVEKSEPVFTGSQEVRLWVKEVVEHPAGIQPWFEACFLDADTPEVTQSG